MLYYTILGGGEGGADAAADELTPEVPGDSAKCMSYIVCRMLYVARRSPIGEIRLG